MNLIFSLSTWQQGEEIIGNISELLHLEPKAITHGRYEFINILLVLVL